jgi:peroxiredoxin (alkyl hydroperoxide reductase subunit C)
VGSIAPDFDLRDQNNAEVSLATLREEHHVLVVFFPFAFSPICTGELDRVRDDLGSFGNDRVATVAVSVDHPFALKAWARQQRYRLPLLSDFWPHGATARAYGVFQPERGFALRGTFLVDRTGIVRFAEVNQPGEPRDQNVWKRALAAL